MKLDHQCNAKIIRYGRFGKYRFLQPRIGYDVANTNREQWVVGVLCYACMGVWEVSRPGEWTISVCCVIKVSLVDWKCYGWAQHHHQGAGWQPLECRSSQLSHLDVNTGNRGPLTPTTGLTTYLIYED